MKLRAKPLAAGTLFVAGALYFYYPNPLWTTGRLAVALGRKNELHRLIAAQELGSRAAREPDKAIPALIAALGDDWGEVRGSASASLCRAGAPAVPYLELALRHESAVVRDMASATLACVKQRKK
jgi:hypothetical protein